MRPIALIIKKACDIAFWGRGAFFFVWRAKDLHEFCIEEYLCIFSLAKIRSHLAFLEPQHTHS